MDVVHTRGAAAPDGDSSPSVGDASDRDDVRLVEAMARGEQAALASLYDRHAPALLGLAQRMLRDSKDAEDLVHDVFVEAWRKSAAFDAARGKPVAWLLARVRSRAIDRLRRRRLERETDESRATDPLGDEPQPAVDPAAQAERAQAVRALAVLAPEVRRVVELGYFEGLTFREIATRCEIPVSTAKSRMAAGLRELRRALGAPT